MDQDSKYDDLRQRVMQFEALELPGQPKSMHMGTSYLVSDLWREVELWKSRWEAERADHEQTMSRDPADFV